MKLNEIITSSAGVMQLFNAEYPNDYATIFGAVTPTQMDFYIYLYYGKRVLINGITADNFNALTLSIITLNLQRWLRIADIFTKEYDVLLNDIEQSTTTETATEKETDNNININSKKNYNDTEFTDGERNTDDRTTNNEISKSVTYNKKGLAGASENSERIWREYELRKTEWHKTIINDIINELCLCIYE